MGTGIDLQHIFHGGDESSVRPGRDHPVFFQVRLEIVFLSARPTVLK